MKLVNGEIRGVDINFNSKDDVLQPVHSFFFCSIMHAYPKVAYINCNWNNPLTALSVTAEEKHDTNDQNKTLQIIDPRNPTDRQRKFMAEKGVIEGGFDPAEWVLVMNQVFDFCQVPVFIFGRACEITYNAPSLSRNMFTLTEWRKLEAIYAERGWPIKDDRRLTDAAHR